MTRTLPLAFAIVWALAPSSVRAQDAPVGPLKEGWEKVVPIPMPELGEGDQYVVSVKGGWLHVRRQTEAGVTDWHIVLARAVAPEPPVIVAPEGSPRFEVSYRGGRYFVREDLNILRTVREKKPNDRTWQGVEFETDRYTSTSSAGSSDMPAWVEGWKNKDGVYVTTTAGPTKEQVDCLVRISPLDPKTEAGKRGGDGTGVVNKSPLRWYWYNSFSIYDDGEVMFAIRLLEARASFAPEVGDPAPPLVAQTIDGKPFDLKDYRGKYVLLDFWATWCTPCIAEFPRLEEVYKAAGQDGRFVLVSLSTDESVEAPRKFLSKRKLPWQQVHLGDNGQVAKDYGITTIPATFLIDPEGKIVATGIRGEEIRRVVVRSLGKP
jgi:thiol-disulfide isomerase/thioredoxin